MTTFFARSEQVRRDWYLVDANGKTLGRLATQLAIRLRGKHKPDYTPHVDTGDHIVVINAEKIRVTGDKLKDKMYYRHTGAIGNLKSMNLEKHAAPSTRSARSSSPSRACCPRIRWVAPCSRNCTCSRARNIRTPRSSPNRSKSETRLRRWHLNKLRHRPPQDVHRACSSEPRHREDHAQ